MRQILALITLSVVVATAQSTNNLVYLKWDYSSNQIAQADASGFPINFVVRGTNQPIPPFATISNMEWTNYPVVGFDGTNYTFKTSYTMNVAGNFYFVASASNGFWGESGMSNTSSTPPISVQLNLKIAPN